MNPYTIQYPFALIFEEKHGSYVYYVGSIDQLYEVALKVLTERFEDEYQYYFQKPSDKFTPTFEEYFQKQFGMSQEAFTKLPEAAQKAMKPAVTSAKSDYKFLEKERDEYLAAEKAVSEKDAKAAFEVLLSRDRNEYEGFRTEHFQNIEGSLPPEHAEWEAGRKARLAALRAEREALELKETNPRPRKSEHDSRGWQPK